MRHFEPRTATAPTLVFTNFITLALIFLFLSSCVASRQVHYQLIYTNQASNEILLGDNNLDEWAGVQGFQISLSKQLQATPSRQYAGSSATFLPLAVQRVTKSASIPQHVIPTIAPAPSNILQRRGTFSADVCPISVQTTYIVSVDGTSTFTVSSTVGPRPTGIPGDAGTSDGIDPSGGSPFDGQVGGAGFSDKEGLITGLVIVITILLASFCALITYFYKKRRNARIQRQSMRQGADPADLVRRMGSKGIVNLSNPSRTLPRPHISSWPAAIAGFFTQAINRVKEVVRRKQASQRDSQSSELLEWKQRMGQGERRVQRWSEVDGEKYLGAGAPVEINGIESQDNQSAASVPEVIPSPAISAVRMRSPSEGTANIATRSSAGSSSGAGNDFVPLVQRKVSSHHLSTARLSAVRPLDTTVMSDLRRSASARRNSRGEPISPSGWIAGFGLASTSHPVDPFNNPSYVSSGGGSSRGSYQSGLSSGRERTFESGDLASPQSGAFSLGSDKTSRASPLNYQTMARGNQLSMVAEHGDVRPDGASDIMSTFGSAFGDRPESTQTHSTHDYQPLDTSQIPRYHVLSDVEEVLTPVADERLSLRPGQSLPPWRGPFDSQGLASHHQGTSSLSSSSPANSQSSPLTADPTNRFQNPFTPEDYLHDVDLANIAAMVPPIPSSGRARRPPNSYRRKSEATSLNGVLPSDVSVTASMTGTSIVERPQSLDTSEWDDPAMRKLQEEKLFFSGSPDLRTDSRNAK